MSEASDVLNAIYTGKLDEARAIASTRPLDAAEAAALGDAGMLFAALREDPTSHAMFSGDGWTPLHLAAFFGRDECAALLLTAGASHATVSRNGTANTPLHAALAGQTNADLVARLLEAGANANALGEATVTPLQIATTRENQAMMDLLRAYGAE